MRQKEEYKTCISNTDKYIKESIDILYEDNHLLVVIKPSNMLTQGDDSKDENILDILKEYIRIKENKKGYAFLGMVQRLDRPTSGIMVFAKTSKAASRLSKEIREKNLEKRYLTIVSGIMPGKINEKKYIENYLLKDHDKNKSYVINKKEAEDKGAKKSKMEYKIIARDEIEKTTLLEINLITGRSHQIRASLKEMGFPVLGDVKYAKYFKYGKKTDKLALFTYYLKFKHPTKDLDLEFKYTPFKENNLFNKYKMDILEKVY